MEKTNMNNGTAKLSYEKPRLVSYGDLRTLTRGGTGQAGVDNGGAATTKSTHGAD